MTVQFQPIAELNQHATNVLIKEIGVVDTLRFLSQFRVGTGDYTAERDKLFEGMSVDDIIREIQTYKANSSQ